jgi:peptidoglycan/LPS O-acetylase OafA/YrhL
MANGKGERRWGSLDVLRAIAVLLVICRHFENTGAGGMVFSGLLRWVSWVGWAGVDLFLSLSGFLISNLLFREFLATGRVQWARFLSRRAFKIYPGFYLLIALSISGVVAPVTMVEGASVVGELFFLQNYVGLLWPHTWSLALEEHFYIVMTILFVLPWRAEIVKSWPVVVGAFCLACLSGRVVTALFVPFDYNTHIEQTHVRIDGLFLGSLAGYLFNFYRQAVTNFIARRRRIYNCVTAVAIIAPFMRELEHSFFAHTVALTILSIGFAMLSLGSVCGAFEMSGRWRGVEQVGRCSYAIYLWHYAVLLRFLPQLESFLPYRLPDPLRFGIYVAASLCMGIAMTRWLEEPFLKLREKWLPAREFHATPKVVLGH